MEFVEFLKHKRYNISNPIQYNTITQSSINTDANWSTNELVTLKNNWESFVNEQPVNMRAYIIMVLQSPLYFNTHTQSFIFFTDILRGNRHNVYDEIDMIKLINTFISETYAFNKISHDIKRRLYNIWNKAIKYIAKSNFSIGPISAIEAEYIFKLTNNIGKNWKIIGGTLSRPTHIVKHFYIHSLNFNIDGNNQLYLQKDGYSNKLEKSFERNEIEVIRNEKKSKIIKPVDLDIGNNDNIKKSLINNKRNINTDPNLNSNESKLILISDSIDEKEIMIDISQPDHEKSIKIEILKAIAEYINKTMKFPIDEMINTIGQEQVVNIIKNITFPWSNIALLCEKQTGSKYPNILPRLEHLWNSELCDQFIANLNNSTVRVNNNTHTKSPTKTAGSIVKIEPTPIFLIDELTEPIKKEPSPAFSVEEIIEPVVRLPIITPVVDPQNLIINSFATTNPSTKRISRIKACAIKYRLVNIIDALKRKNDLKLESELKWEEVYRLFDAPSYATVRYLRAFYNKMKHRQIIRQSRDVNFSLIIKKLKVSYIPVLRATLKHHNVDPIQLLELSSNNFIEYSKL